MGERLPGISKHLTAIPKRSGGSLMRVYRDTRFSRDKTPYKTNIGIQFRHEQGKDVHAPGLYFHLDRNECFLGVGMWHPEREALAAIRQAIVDDPKAWRRVRDGAGVSGGFRFRRQRPEAGAAWLPGRASVHRRPQAQGLHWRCQHGTGGSDERQPCRGDGRDVWGWERVDGVSLWGFGVAFLTGPGGEGILPSLAPIGAHGLSPRFEPMRLAAHSEGTMPSPPRPVALCLTATYSLNCATTPMMDALASPKSIRVLSPKNRGLSTPANPDAIERLSTNTVRAWSTLMMGMP